MSYDETNKPDDPTEPNKPKSAIEILNGKRAAPPPALTGSIVDAPPDDAASRGSTADATAKAIADAGAGAAPVSPAESAEATRRHAFIVQIHAAREARNAVAVSQATKAAGWTAFGVGLLVVLRWLAKRVTL